MAMPGAAERGRHNGVLAPLTAALAQRVEAERAGPVTPRDPDFVRRMIPPTTRYVSYFSPEVRGIENLPSSGPALVVGNHSCLFYAPDTWVVALAITARRGLDAPAYALAYDLLFGIPVVGPALRRLGAVPAAGREAERLLAEGNLVLVYPGGDYEACRPWADRNRIDFADRKGFIKLALRAGVPVVPVVAQGSHDAVVVLSRGERLARTLGLDRLRIKVFPIMLGPFGVTTMLAPPLPMPSSVTVEFMTPIDWSALGPEAADDGAVVSACYDEITRAMQATLDRLTAERPHPVVRGWMGLLRGGSAPSGLTPPRDAVPAEPRGPAIGVDGTDRAASPRGSGSGSGTGTGARAGAGGTPGGLSPVTHATKAHGRARPQPRRHADRAALTEPARQDG